MTHTDYVSGEIKVPIDNLHPNPDNPRRQAGDVTDLAASIREHGLLQSLLVRPMPTRKGHYYIEAGFRRWTACRTGTTLETLPCRVWEARIDVTNPKQHSITVGLIENIHREGLDPIEKAQAMGKLRDEHNLNQAQIAKALGLTDATVNYYLSLLELDLGSQERVRRGKVKVKDAVEAVRASRRRDRRRTGKKPVNVVWEADWFVASHPLARKAATMCDARGHTRRRRLGKKAKYQGACGQCWETVIRNDQDIVGSVTHEIGTDAAGKVLTGLAEPGGNHKR